MWADITSEYDVSDSAGVQLLAIACQALDRAEMLRELIDKQGVMVENKNGSVRENPLLRHELNGRAFVVRTLSRLGPEFRAIAKQPRPNGRQEFGLGWEL